MGESHVFLVATVGRRPGPLYATLAHWRPSRVCCVTPADARSGVVDSMLAGARGRGVELEPGQWNVVTVSDCHDLQTCLARLRSLTSEVEEWLARGDAYRVVVDFTEGSRCMSAALALHAQRWPCVFSYVASPDGGSAPEPGADDVVHQDNPWDALGYQAIEDACELFNRGHCAAAADVLRSARDRADDPTVKRELATLGALARAYAAWDRFDHGGAASGLAEALKNSNDLRVILGTEDGDRRVEVLVKHRQLLASAPSDPVPDLVANAMRRARESRYDDAVARLYRAVEALAQEALRRHGVDTARVSIADLPEALRNERCGRAGPDGTCVIGLQDAYRLLHELGDPLGSQFLASGLGGATSPLSARNQSILAHGFQPVGEAVYRRLLEATLALSGLSAAQLPAFPFLELLPAGRPGDA